MGKLGKFSVKGLKEFERAMKRQLTTNPPERFAEKCARELAKELYGQLIENTPSITGTLRSGWTIGNIENKGGVYIVELINPVEYATYVNYGHRTRDGGGWVEGKFFVEISIENIDRIKKPLLEKLMNEYLNELIG